MNFKENRESKELKKFTSTIKPEETIISANAEYLLGLINKNKYSLDEIDSLSAIQEYSTQAGKITQGLLDFSREETEPQKIDINKEIETTLTFLDKQLDKQSIKLIVNLGRSIPKIIGNRSQFRQVFLNLILNAKDAMPKGGSLTIVTQVKRKRFIEIAFEDTGCGISEDKMKRIFDLNFTTKEEVLGKITLPLIYLRNSYDVTNRIYQRICEYLDKAKSSLKIIQNSTYKLSLEGLIQKFKVASFLTSSHYSR